MKSLFDLEGKLYTFLSKTADLLLIGLAWLVCCIPIATILPATTALFHAVYQCVFLERGKIFSTYRAAFVRNFKRNFWIGIGLLALICAVCVLWWLLSLHAGHSFAAFGAVCLLILCFLTLLWMVWLIPVCTFFSERASVVLRLSFVLSLRQIGNALWMLLLLAVGAAAVFILPPLILLVPSLSVYLSIPRLTPALEHYLSQPLASLLDS